MVKQTGVEEEAAVLANRRHEASEKLMDDPQNESTGSPVKWVRITSAAIWTQAANQGTAGPAWRRC